MGVDAVIRHRVSVGKTVTKAGGLSVTVRAGIDRHVGSQIQLRRALLRMSREQLAAQVGVTAAEMEAYEAGQRRVPADLLVDIAETMAAPISYFFADLCPR